MGLVDRWEKMYPEGRNFLPFILGGHVHCAPKRFLKYGAYNF